MRGVAARGAREREGNGEESAHARTPPGTPPRAAHIPPRCSSLTPPPPLTPSPSPPPPLSFKALIYLKPGGNGEAPVPAGDALGTHFRYGWNGYGFTTPSLADQPVFGDVPSVAITQLGYPGWADRGRTMQISNSPAHRFFTNATTTGAVLKQMLRGTAMTGGSSGGPWMVNFGIDAAGVRYGAFADRNVVVGVTSWGWSDPQVKAQGVSYFGENAEFPGGAYGANETAGFPGYGAGNIGHLVWQAAEGQWGLKAKGLY